MFHLPKNIRRKLFLNSIAIFIFSTTIFSQKDTSENVPIFAVCGRYSTVIDTNRKIASDNDSTILLPTFTGKITAVNYKGLNKIWESDLGGEIISNIVATGENAFVVTKSSLNQNSTKEQKILLHALDKKTGITQWQKEIETTQDIYLNTFENHVIVADGIGKILSFSRTSGDKDWEQNLNLTNSSTPYKFQDTLAIGLVEKKIALISLSSGQIREVFALDHIPVVIASDYKNETIFTGDDKGAVRSIDSSNKTRNWIFQRGAKISSVQLTDRGLLVTSLDNFIYLINKKNGELIWKRRLSGRVVSAPLITNDYIISASFEDTSALIINPANGRLLNKIDLESRDFFTGAFLKLHKTNIFTTTHGIFSVSDESCQ